MLRPIRRAWKNGCRGCYLGRRFFFLFYQLGQAGLFEPDEGRNARQADFLLLVDSALLPALRHFRMGRPAAVCFGGVGLSRRRFLFRPDSMG